MNKITPFRSDNFERSPNSPHMANQRDTAFGVVSYENLGGTSIFGQKPSEDFELTHPFIESTKQKVDLYRKDKSSKMPTAFLLLCAPTDRSRVCPCHLKAMA